jgi:hypothetical protein
MARPFIHRAMHKKAQVEYLLQNAFRIGFMIIALLAFFLLINYYVNNKIDTNQIQEEVLLNRILYSDAIMKNDVRTGNVYTGIIDLGKFNNATLDQSINYGSYNRHVGAKLKLLNKDPDPSKQFIADAYLNKIQYNSLNTLTNSVTGKGSGTRYITQYPVTYIGFDNNYYYGTLVVEIIVPNS